jgi:putative flippase GtrA
MFFNLFSYVYSKQRNLVLYAFIGVFSATIDFLIFTLLIKYFDFAFIKSNVISVTGGITTSFILNRNLNFNLKDKTRIRALSFFIIGLSGMFVSSLILGFLIHILPISIFYLKIISAFFVVLMQFILNKYLTFKKFENG